MKKKLLSGLLIGSALFALTSCSIDDLLKSAKSATETATGITETTTGIAETTTETTTTETTTTTENVVAGDFVFEYAKLKGYQGEKEDFLEDLKSENITVSINDGVSLQYKNGDVLELFKFKNLIENLVPGVNYNYGYLRLIDGTMCYYHNNTLYDLFTVSDITGYELDEIELIIIDGPWVSWRTKDSEWKKLISCDCFGGLSTDITTSGDTLYDYSKLLGYNKTPLEFLNEIDFSNYQFDVVYETYLGYQYNKMSFPLVSLEDLKEFKRNISFNSGSEKETISLGLGETLTELPAPTKEGYKFLCWEYNGVEFNFAKYAYFPQDIELEAKWVDEDAIIVNYHLMDEDETVLRNVIEPEVYTELYVPERLGYKFLGWLDEDGEAVTDGKFQDIDELHLYANWIEDTPIVISVSYYDDKAIDVFDALIKNYQEETGCYFDYRIDVEASNIEYGLLQGDYDSDLFMVSSPSLDRIYEAGFLAPVSNPEVSERNYKNVVEFATYDGTLYAYPISFDYAVLLFYDKSIIEDADVTSLEAIVEACEKNQVNFAYELYNAWYSSGFFFGMGCEMTHTTKDGFFVAATDDFWSEKGVAALQTMYRVLNSDYFVEGSYNWDFAANVSGTWNLEEAKKVWGDNLGVAPLPSFTYNGEKHQISQLTYTNYLCVNANKSKDRVALLNDLADYLTNSDAQLLYTKLGKYPTNAEANEKYAEVNPYAEAIGASLSNVIVQNEIYGDWWNIYSDMIRKVKDSEGTKEELLTILEEYYDALQASFEGNYPDD